MRSSEEQCGTVQNGAGLRRMLWNELGTMQNRARLYRTVRIHAQRRGTVRNRGEVSLPGQVSRAALGCPIRHHKSIPDQ